MSFYVVVVLSRRADLIRRGAIAAVLVIGSAACTDPGADPTSTTAEPPPSTTVPPRQGDGELFIGAYLPLTGAGATLGNPMVAAIEQAISDINAAGGVLGRPVRFMAVDETGTAGPDELLAAGVDAIVGPASSRVALSQMSAAFHPDTGVVVCSPSATSLALDELPDNGLFFRTAPSDSLQMTAIARLVRQTGVTTVAVAYLDDPYGRGMEEAFLTEAEARNLEVVASVGFSGDEDDFASLAGDVATLDPGAIVVLGDADDGSRFLVALDRAASARPVMPRVVINDSIRARSQTLQSLSDGFRAQLTGVAPHAGSIRDDGPDGSFTAHAVDCVNLIALAAVVTGSDQPRSIAAAIPSVGADGRRCPNFAQCVEVDAQGLNIDYDGVSGFLELRNSNGDPRRAYFESFAFDAQGREIDNARFDLTATSG